MSEQSEELLSKVNSTLDWVGDAVDGAQGFVMEQAPLYAQEVVTYNLMYHGAWLSASALALLLFISLATFLFWKQPFDDDEMDIGAGVVSVTCAVVSVICAVVALIVFFCHLQTWSKAHWAPRVLILEHIQNKL